MTEQNEMPRPQGHPVTINERTVYIPEWNMQQHIDKTKYVMPLVSEPLANAAAVSGEDDDDDGSFYMAAVIQGVTKALGNADLNVTIPVLLDGVLVENDAGVPKMISVKNAEEFGFKFHHILRIGSEVIKVNLGPLFQDGLQEMFAGM